MLHSSSSSKDSYLYRTHLSHDAQIMYQLTPRKIEINSSPQEEVYGLIFKGSRASLLDRLKLMFH